MLNINKDNDIIIDYILRYRSSNDIRIRNELISRCWYSIQNYSKYFYKLYRIFELIDYEAMVIEAFIHATNKFNLSINIKFSSYFYFRCKGEIKTKLRSYFNKQKYYNTIPFDYELSIKDNRIDIENDYIIVDEYNRYMERYEAIFNEIKAEKSKRVFREYYFNGLSYNEIAKKIGMKSNSVRSIISHYYKKYSLFLH